MDLREKKERLKPLIWDLKRMFHRNHNGRGNPYYRLWFAVLERALQDLCERNPSIRRDAELWFKSDRRGVGSFLWVCELLDFNPQWLRKRLMPFLEGCNEGGGEKESFGRGIRDSV